MEKFKLVEQFKQEVSAYPPGLTDLAEKAGVSSSRTSLSKLLSGDRDSIGFETFVRVCTVLGLELHKPKRKDK